MRSELCVMMSPSVSGELMTCRGSLDIDDHDVKPAIRVTLSAGRPIARSTRVVSNCEYDDALVIRAINDREGESIDDEAHCVSCGTCTGIRESQSSDCSFFYFMCKCIAKTWLFCIVIDHFLKEFTSCRRDESYFLHLSIRLASANTSSAGYT